MVTKMFAKWSAASLGRKTSVFWKRLLRSQKHCFFALLAMFTVTSVVYLFTGYREPLKPFPYNDKTNQIRMNEEFLQRDKGTGCDMPQLDPFSDVAMRYVKETPKIVCDGLDWVDCYHSKCYVIKEILSKMKDVVCNYKDIVHVNDQHYYIGDPVKVYGNASYRLNSSDHVKVSCKGVDKNGLGIISQRWFGYKSGLRPVPKPLVSRTGRENTSDILILGFDSTSRNGFIRKMPKSYKFLKDVLNATIMKSYNIVGEGTSNALYPILTGLELPDWESFPKDKTMDHKTFLFHHLKNDGYRTAYFEDMPWIGTFQRFYHGFDSCPADHYLRSFLMEESSKGRKWWRGVKGRYCIGNVPQYGLLMNLTKQFLDLDGKHFCLTFIADISHDDFNVISTSDDDMVAFLQDFLDKGRQKNTLLIVMGDHGAKYESIRRTYQGRLEERLPLMTIKLPETLLKSRPNVQRVLEANAEVLTTPYDLHTTLLDVVGLRELANSYKVEGSKLERGLSMLEPIPKSRSCGDAGILPHWCACTKWRNVSRSDPVHQQAATVLAEYIDNITNGRRSLCAKRKLTSIDWVMKLIPSSEMSLRDGNNRKRDNVLRGDQEEYQVKLTMNPGAAVFEATLTYYVKEDYFLINERDISRISSYGDESICIRDSHPQLNKYCYCKDKMNAANYAFGYSFSLI
ncbi:uncharacterized protein LOC101737713 isoform X2 [Bombyx mori]|uniref:Uncharacterized protein n=2 Tax=Bombyx mori TaxID=7091 RepID=A0A8R2HPP5_BOMMO|nr:uncharacterized protein LOC101737713 isoform X1 [Bombyx mori]